MNASFFLKSHKGLLECVLDTQIMYDNGHLCCLWIKQADTELFSSVEDSIKIYT